MSPASLTTEAPSALLAGDVPAVTRAGLAAGVWRCGRCLSRQERPLLLFSWVLAVTVICLAVGLAGLTTPVTRPIVLLEHAAAMGDDDAGEAAFFEIEMTAPAVEEFAPPENAQDLAEQAPDALPEVTLEELEIPELVDVLKREDVFEIPAAAPLEPLLEPVKPTQPKPASAPARRATASTAPNTTARAGSSTTAAAGVPGGGDSARGGKNYFPRPAYPGFAKARRLQGKVGLSIQFGENGRPTSVQVYQSSGYSDLDTYTVNHIKRTWKAGTANHPAVRAPFDFQLR